MPTRSSPHNEDLRQLEHLAPILFAFLLKYLTWSQALILAFLAILYALLVSPHFLRYTQRPEEVRRGFSVGKVSYALSVFLLILFFRDEEYIVAAVWANLSVGDAASNLIGRHYGRAKLPWNQQKTWLGVLGSVVCASIATFVLILWTGLPADLESPVTISALYAFTISIVCSFAETVPLPVDDNIIIVIVGSGFLCWLSRAAWPPRWSLLEGILGLLVSGIAGLIAYSLKTVTLGGLIWGVLLGTIVFVAYGGSGFLLLGTFFVLGSVFTRIGFEKKRLTGRAETNLARRSARHVLGKGFAPLVASLSSLFVAETHYLAVGFVAAVATALYDTTATELGQVLSRRQLLLTSFQGVPKGTPGAVSLSGSLSGFVAGCVIALEALYFGMIDETGLVWVLLSAGVWVHIESVLAGLAGARTSGDGQLLNAFHTTAAMLMAMVMAGIRL